MQSLATIRPGREVVEEVEKDEIHPQRRQREIESADAQQGRQRQPRDDAAEQQGRHQRYVEVDPQQHIEPRRRIGAKAQIGRLPHGHHACVANHHIGGQRHDDPYAHESAEIEEMIHVSPVSPVA